MHIHLGTFYPSLVLRFLVTSGVSKYIEIALVRYECTAAFQFYEESVESNYGG
jgi:hypothetical protein